MGGGSKECGARCTMCAQTRPGQAIATSSSRLPCYGAGPMRQALEPLCAPLEQRSAPGSVTCAGGESQACRRAPRLSCRARWPLELRIILPCVSGGRMYSAWAALSPRGAAGCSMTDVGVAWESVLRLPGLLDSLAELSALNASAPGLSGLVLGAGSCSAAVAAAVAWRPVEHIAGLTD